MPDEGEPYWTGQDRAYVLALQAHQRTLHTCGEPRGEAFAKENQFGYRAEVARCHACAAKDRAVEKFRESGGEMHGLNVRLTRTPSESER